MKTAHPVVLLLTLSACMLPVPDRNPDRSVPDGSVVWTFDAGSPDAGLAEKGLAATAFCDALAHASCDHSIRCGHTSRCARSECFAVAQSACAANAESVALGHKTLDATRASACLDALSGACGLSVSVGCPEAFVPAVPRGGACRVPSDCADATDNCAGPDCLKTCQPAGALGALCRQDNSCNVGLECDWTTRICRPPLPRGGVGTDCSTLGPYACDDTTFCDFQKNTCAALPVAGQSCRTYEPRCTGTTWCSGTTCQPKVANGAACTSSAACQTGLVCDTACQPKRPIQTACTRTEQCQGDLRCLGGVCTTALAEGAACDAPDACAGYLGCDRVLRKCMSYTVVSTVGAACSDDRLICWGRLDCVLGASGSPGTCQPSTYCACGANEWCKTTNTAAFTCEPRKADGEPCSVSAECLNLCVPRKNSAPTCGRLGELGESCGWSKVLPESCAFPYQCTGEGTCQHAGGNGESCLDGSVCFAGGCNEQGVCGPKLPAGAKCYSGIPCESGQCVLGKCSAVCRS